MLNPVAATLPARLQRLLDELGVTQQEFAEKTGFTQSYISKILKGKPPGARFLSLVAHEFYLNPAWLRDGQGEMFISPAPGLSPQDTEMVAKYRLLTPDEQSVINTMMDALIKKR